jgi:hypothetical protein
MKALILIAAALALAGCRPDPEVKLVTVTASAPEIVYPAECYADPAPFPTIPVAKGQKRVPEDVLVETLDRGYAAHKAVTDDKRVCRAALPPRPRPTS